MRAADETQLESFCRSIWEAAVQGSVRIVLDAAFAQNLNGPLVDAVAQGQGTLGQVAVRLTPKLPLVAVGGPVKVYYGEVAQRLGCEVVFAPHFDVANAVGAASALVACLVAVRVEGDGNGLFRVTGHGAPETFSAAALALAAAEARATEAVLRMAKAQGAQMPKAKLTWTKQHLPEAKNDDGLLTAELRAEAKGAPH